MDLMKRRFHQQDISARCPRAPNRGHCRRGFSLVELLIVIAVVVILIALLLPVVGMARAKSRQTKCASNLRQIYQAYLQASAKIAAPFPTSQWPDRLRTYVEGESSVNVCPDVTNSGVSYGMNTRLPKMADQDNGRIALLDFNALEAKVVGQKIADLDISWPSGRAPRHFRQQNVSFADGHVESKTPDAIDPRFCVYYEQFWRPARDSQFKLDGCYTLGTTPTSGTGSSGATATSTGPTTSASTTTGATTGSTTTGGTTTTGSSTTTGGTTTSGTPDPTCYDPDNGFPELQGYTITAFCGGNPFSGTPIPWDPNSPRFMLMAQTCNQYILWFEDWGDIGTASPIDLAINPVRQPNGSIQLCVTQLAGSVCSYTIRDKNGNAIAGLTNWSGNAAPGTKRCATNPIAGAVARLCLCAPTADAGTDGTFVLPTVTTTLNGSASDGTVLWTQVGGPPGVTFGSPNAAVTSATFPATAGIYTLRLTATNAIGSDSDDVSVTVYAAGTYMPGLKGEYFDASNNWSGAPVFTRVDANLNFPWTPNSLVSPPGPDSFSVRWTGQIKSEFTENYTLHVSHDDGTWIDVNGVQVFGTSGWCNTGTFQNSTSFPMTAGQWVSITIRMSEGGGGDHIGVKWSSASTPQAFIPSANLRTVP